MHSKKVQAWGASAPTVLVVNFCAHTSDLNFERALYSHGGQQLRLFMKKAGFDMDTVHYASLIPFAPILDQTERLLVPAKGIPNELKKWLKVGTKYLKPDLFPHLAEFQSLLKRLKPNLVITLGTEATSLITGEQKHSEVRGTVMPSSLDSSIKVMPITHPAGIFRMPQAQVVFSADLAKAVKETKFPEVRRVRREITIPETFEDCQDWWKANGIKGGMLTVDIETVPSYKVITCIGFATSTTKGLTIPLYQKDKAGGHYWSPSEELYVVQFIGTLLANPAFELNFQGGAYDVQWIYEQLGLPSMNYRHDTMLMHHALYPEMRKGLGFLASLYTTEPSWKGMVSFKKDAGDKADG